MNRREAAKAAARDTWAIVCIIGWVLLIGFGAIQLVAAAADHRDEPRPLLLTPTTMAYPPFDVDCEDLARRNIVVPYDDPFGLDGDGDGIGCES